MAQNYISSVVFMKEDAFVQLALDAAAKVLQPPLIIRRKSALLYQITVNNSLEVTINSRKPSRGQSAFETDLCVFEQISEDLEIPRVVLEFKTKITTHDILTYSAKAGKHKNIYPYLRYGLIIANEITIPRRFFTHNDSIDFCIAAAAYTESQIHEIIASMIHREVESSRLLENIAYGNRHASIFRNEIQLQTNVS